MPLDMNDTEIDPLIECLLELARSHGKTATREALLSGLPLVDNRLSPALFQRAADRIGLTTRTAKKSLRELPLSLLPAVLLLEQNQACILVGWTGAGQAIVKYPDLIGSAVQVELAELEKSYSGHTLLARPRFQIDDRSSRGFEPQQGHWFWSVLKANMPVYRDVLLAAFFINLFALVLPLFTMNVYDRVVPNYALETLWVLALGVGLVLLADLGLRTMRGYFLDLAGRRVDVKLSTRIMEQVLGLRMEARPGSAGSFAANLRSFETVRDFITSAAITSFIDVPFALVFLVALAWIAPPMAIPMLVGTALILLYALLTRKPMERLTEDTYQASAMRNATLIESLVGLDTLKALGAEGVMQRRWEKTALYLAEVGERLRLLSASTVNVTLWIQQWVAIAVIVLGVYLIAAGELTMGGLIAASMLTSRALGAFGQVAGLLGQFHNARTALVSLDEVMNKPVERPPGVNFLSRQTFQGAIEFKDVSFTYPDQDVAALKKVSFKLKPGEHVGVLGRIGSGKSTLQKLIMGLYQPTDGAVLVDGIDMRQLDPAELRQQVGYVPQEATLFYGSLRENLVLAHPHASDDDILRAARLAGLHSFVDAHPRGFDMAVGERGDSLSGGQRKAISLARSIIHDPPILVLDEPTGSMDHSSEAWVKKQLNDYAKGKTMLVVTHRTSLLDMVDRIIVIDGGQIVADGPKDSVVDALRSGRIGKVA